jgi:TRAP-type C4-dicarboxylate transport system permease small subunit
MNCERSLIGSVVFLLIGLGLIFGFCHGTIGLSGAYPIAGAAMEVSIKTTGWPAIVGVSATLIGFVLLIVALVQAVVAQVRWPGDRPEAVLAPK